MIKCGMSEMVITPKLGSPIPGAGHERYSKGIKDDLFVKALVLEIESQTLAFIVLDAIDVARKEVDSIRNRVSTATGIAKTNIAISSTHAHTSGPTIQTTYVKAVDEIYLTWLVEKASDAATLAFANRCEASIGFGLGREDSIAFNRRFHMKDGSVRTNPGVRNPDIISATGPIDPDVAVIRIDDRNGKPIGIVTNYACHADVVGGLEYSGDFPGQLSRTIKQVFGDQVVSLFFQGASGNINHVDVSGSFPFERDRHFQKMGRILAGEAIKVREKITLSDNVNVQVRSVFVPITFRHPTEAELSAASLLLQSEEKSSATELKLAKQAVELALQPIEETQVEIQVFTFGDVAIVCLPSEIFVEFGLEIKEKSPFQLTIVNELSNGSISGYVCTQEAYKQGGYENRFRKYSRQQVEAGDIYVQTALQLLNEMKP